MIAIRYIVNDVEAALDFYRTCLEFEVEDRPADDCAVMARGEIRLFLTAPDSADAGSRNGQKDPAPGGWNRFRLRTDDLDGLIQRLEQGGIRIRGEVTEGTHGRQVLVEDPSGNKVELYQPQD